MSAELIATQEFVAISMSNDTAAETHGMGDSCMEKLEESNISRDNFYEISEGSSHPSCTSFKKRQKDMDVQIEDLTKKLEITENPEESQKLATSLSLCVMMESRSLELTESSEECIPNGSNSKGAQRFFTPDEIREASTVFKQCDGNNDGFLELTELKLALEKLSVPQTHLVAKQLMAEFVDENLKKLSFCQFLLTYAEALKNRRIKTEAKKCTQHQQMSSEEAVNVSVVGVSGAKRFFEDKIAQQITQKNQDSQLNL